MTHLDGGDVLQLITLLNTVVATYCVKMNFDSFLLNMIQNYIDGCKNDEI